MSFEGDLRTEYAEVTKRLMGPKVKPPAYVPPPPPDDPWFAFPSLPYDDCIQPPKRRMDAKGIILEVCAKHEISYEMIRSPRRNRIVVAARHEAFYRLSQETSMSLPNIGMKLGGKDHTTVLNGIARHKERVVDCVEKQNPPAGGR